jgi:hypothetical protein
MEGSVGSSVRTGAPTFEAAVHVRVVIAAEAAFCRRMLGDAGTVCCAVPRANRAGPDQQGQPSAGGKGYSEPSRH